MANKLWTVCIFILIVEVAERLCYYSISGTQRNFLNESPAKMPLGQAGAINSVFTMLSYLSCFLGGYLADQWLGRYKTILIFATIYFAGTVMVALTANPNLVGDSWALPVYLAGCLVFISLGTGAIKPNVMTFGAAQYDVTDPVEKVQQKTFFSYFYLMINVGAGVSFGFLTNIATSKVEGDNIGNGFFECYCIAAGCMGFAVLSFLAGTCRYKKEALPVHKPMISVITKYLCRSAKSPRGMMAVVGWLLIPVYITLNLVGSIEAANPIGKDMTYVCMALCLVSCIGLVLGHMKNDWMVEFTDEVAGTGVTLLDAKKVCGMVPQLLLINIGFNIPYNAMNNAYPTLACQMDVRLPWDQTQQLNGAFTNLGDCIAIIVGVPVIESIIYPMIERRQQRAISRKTKYTIGFLLACLANLVAIFIEQVRRGRPFIDGKDDEGISKCAAAGIHMSDMSCFWAFIPMFITGIGEILVNPVVYEFAFSEAPPQLLSVVQAFNLVVAGSISNCITGPLSILVFPNNLNNFDETAPVSQFPSKRDVTIAGKDYPAGGYYPMSGPSPDGRGDVNITFIINIVIGLCCLAAYLVVEKLDDCEPEDTRLKKEEGDQPLAAAVEDQDGERILA